MNLNNNDVKHLKLIILITLLLSLMSSCGRDEMDGSMQRFSSIQHVSRASWNRLAQRSILFGHKSVGYDIIEGIQDVLKENPDIKLTIEKAGAAKNNGSPVFFHAEVGDNSNPASKFIAFSRLMQNAPESRIHIAFMKLCYADVDKLTDVQLLFDAYRKTIASLKAEYSEVTFIHVTVPLKTVQTGLKAWLKQIMGKAPGNYEDNVKRNLLNQLIKEEYDGKDPIYDLAKVESTYPNGSRSTYEFKKKTCYSLVPEYTHDGGHLNMRGRKIAGEQLLILLSQISDTMV